MNRVILYVFLLMMPVGAEAQDRFYSNGWRELNLQDMEEPSVCEQNCGMEEYFISMNNNRIRQSLLPTTCSAADKYMREILIGNYHDIILLQNYLFNIPLFREVLRPRLSIALLDSSICGENVCYGWWCYNVFRDYRTILDRQYSSSTIETYINDYKIKERKLNRRIVVENEELSYTVRQYMIVEKEMAAVMDCVIMDVDIVIEMQSAVSICLQFLSGDISYPIDHGIPPASGSDSSGVPIWSEQ